MRRRRVTQGTFCFITYRLGCQCNLDRAIRNMQHIKAFCLVDEDSIFGQIQEWRNLDVAYYFPTRPGRLRARCGLENVSRSTSR
jgi:hypothetical protein